MNEKLVLISADHNGVALKSLLKERLKEMSYNVVDLGPYNDDGKVDYNLYASNLGRSIGNGDAPRGILICGTGVGVNIVANRFPNVRAVLAHNPITAEKSREHNNSNVLCLGAWINNDQVNIELMETWLKNEWADLRHSKRVNMIDKNKTGIVLANGVFDVLHRGHLELLKFARAQGSRLVVALDSDQRVKENKGNDRPINNFEDRRAMLEGLSCVDTVVVFENTEDLKNLYSSINPDVVVKGSEWTSNEIRARDGIPDDIIVKVYPLVDGLSSTNSIKSMQGKS